MRITFKYNAIWAFVPFAKKFLRDITLIFSLLLIGIITQQCSVATEKKSKPNFIIIMADDLGYGDLGVFGHPTIRTPNLDRMAAEGQKWTNFYASAPACTPSRAGLLTGRLPIRSGMTSDNHHVLFNDSKGGLPESEVTIASALKTSGYTSACIGKWHLGSLPQYSANSHGFDYFFGMPCGHDDDLHEDIDYFAGMRNPKVEYFNAPLMRNAETIDRPTDLTSITKKFTQEAVSFIEQNKDKPFFLYLAHTAPHVPLFSSREFKDKSIGGVYGDVVEEIDWSVGEVLAALKQNGLDDNTFVVFTSDNGPWKAFNELGGSAGLFSGGKGSRGTFEGGLRMPTIFKWTGKLKSGVVMDMATNLDLLPTISKLANVSLPNDRMYDGYDISPVMFGTGKNPRDVVFYYRDDNLLAIRKGKYKVHFEVRGENDNIIFTGKDAPLLFNLDIDPSERVNIADKHPEIIEEMKEIMKHHKAGIVPVENQLEKR
jgi:arylsulfatase A-like enzyme